jgi:hypothetical protein
MIANTTSQRLEPAELRAVALVLAEVVRYGHPELAHWIVGGLKLNPSDFEGVIDEADMEGLRKALAG